MATGVLLVADAEEVPIVTTVPTRRALDDHASHDLVHPAPPAEQSAFEVVVVDSAALAGNTVLIEHPLDPVERLLVDERLVASWNLLTLVRDDADVVVAAEEPRPLFGGHRLRSSFGCAARAQAAVLHDALDVEQAVIASGVELPGLFHQWPTRRVDFHRADLATVVGLQQHVQVSDRRLPESAALAGLLPHLERDVRPVLAGAIFVEGSENSVHQLANRAVVDRLGGADQRDTTLLEVGHDDGIVQAVTGEPRQLVDDNVVDVAFTPDAVEHPLKLNAFGHLGSGSPRFGVLANDVEPHLFCLPEAGRALGRQGDAFRIEVLVHLPWRGHSKIEQCPCSWWRFFVGDERDVLIDPRLRRNKRRWPVIQFSQKGTPTRCGQTVALSVHFTPPAAVSPSLGSESRNAILAMPAAMSRLCAVRPSNVTIEISRTSNSCRITWRFRQLLEIRPKLGRMTCRTSGWSSRKFRSAWNATRFLKVAADAPISTIS
nr:hypothetical protein [Nocardia brasiliensis]